MQETTEQPTLAPEAPEGLAASALQAEAWAGEPFLHSDEDSAVALAPETARRRALDDALAEIEAGAREPSYEWKIRYALMLGLERVLSQSPPRLASGTDLRRHQIDALAGMLTELIAATQVEPENGNGENGHEAEPEEDEEDLGVHLVAAQLGAGRKPRRAVGDDALEPEHERVAHLPLVRRLARAGFQLGERVVQRAPSGGVGRKRGRRIFIRMEEGLPGPCFGLEGGSG